MFYIVFSAVFEYHLNEKVVYSVRLLGDWPDFDDLIEITYWRNQVSLFIYLCTIIGHLPAI